ncbi:MAG: plasmid pRiA4b ORF-3 family protein, partial [Streptosporangiaceae bacterium]
LLTGREVLRKPDVPAAAAVIGVEAPQTLRSAADVPDLHRAWLLALAAGLVAVTDGKAVARSIALPDQDAEVLSVWLAALRASAAAEYGPRSVPDDILLSFLEVVAEDPAGPRVQGWVQRRSACWTLLNAFGAVAEGPEVTPLGRWAMERLADSQPVIPENLTTAEMLARLAMFDQAQRRGLGWEWMAVRDPEETVREILRAAASMSPRMRWLAADVAEEAGEEALPAWREALSEPLLAVHARCALIAWDDAPELTDAEQLWLAVEAAAVGLEERRPDEALSSLWERVPGTNLDDRLAAIRSSGHPAAAEVTGAVADLTASGVPLTIDHAMQLKVQLKYLKPPIWRSVVVPSLATLGDLHRVIQTVFGWDGDHLHAFRVGGRNYSDPSFGLEETGEEEDVRVRDAFRGKIKVGYEYDFGASWRHEITLQKVLPLDPTTTYPVCVAFQGESPEEYPYAYLGGRKRKPYSLGSVNARLAKLGGRG